MAKDGFESWLKNKLLFLLFTGGVIGVAYLGYKAYKKIKGKE